MSLSPVRRTLRLEIDEASHRATRTTMICYSHCHLPLVERRAVVPWLSSIRNSAIRRTTSLLRTRVATRSDRPWTALVYLPLAMTCAALAQVYWLLVPLVFLTWWWCSVGWRFAWVLGITEACFGVQWAYLGIYCLTTYPRHRLLVGVLWAGYAAVVAAAAAINRSRFNRRYGW